MKYKFLSERGTRYATEEGTQGHRAHMVTFENPIGDGLKAAIVDLRNLLRPGAPVAAAVPSVGTGSVKDLAKFHQAKQDQFVSQAAVGEARKKVEMYRKWLAQEGVTADKDGNITNIDHRVVVYDKDAATQGLTQIHFRGGCLFTDAACTTRFDTTKMVTHFSGPGIAIYVMSPTGKIHASTHVVGNRHHSSLLGGGNVACGGEIKVMRGHIQMLSNKSGHYAPSINHLLQVLHQLQKEQVPLNFEIRTIQGGAIYANAGALLAKLELRDEPDYELGALLAYSAHLDDVTLGGNGWRWRFPTEKAGVHVIATNAFVPHKQVRQWLRGTGRRPSATLYQDRAEKSTGIL